MFSYYAFSSPQQQLFIGKKTTEAVCLLQQGADSLYQQLRPLDPAAPLLTGAIATDGVVIPAHGPFDRVALGLQLREWGAEFPSILLLACAKLSLDSFISRVEASALVEDLLVGGGAMTRHVAAHHLVQAFLQQQLHPSLGGEGTGVGVQHSGPPECVGSSGDLFREAAAREDVAPELSALLEQSLQLGGEGGGKVLDAVSSLGLEEEWRRPLLLSGKELKQEVLTRIPHGPVFTQVSARLLEDLPLHCSPLILLLFHI
jgi:hypothetical protein